MYGLFVYLVIFLFGIEGRIFGSEGIVYGSLLILNFSCDEVHTLYEGVNGVPPKSVISKI